jgi:hypothetical protein
VTKHAGLLIVNILVKTMAEYYAEGLLSRLLGLNSGYAVDGMVSNVLKQYIF